jgi:hypothetical protein
VPKRNFDMQTFETEDYDESPLPGETLVFKDNGKEYVPPEEPKEKEKKEESRSLTEMYGADAELIREVINYWGLNWPQIQFVATHGMPTMPLGSWRAEAEEKHAEREEEFAASSRKQGWGRHTPRPFEVTGTPVRFSKLKLAQFYKRYERQIWEAAHEFITSTEGGDPSPFECIAKVTSFANVQSLASLTDVAAAAASWAMIEACQTILSDKESNEGEESGSSADYSSFRDIWEPPVEHEELHTDVGFDESIMRRLRSGN